MAKRAIFDPWLLLITGLLGAGGLFMVGSASNNTALDLDLDASTYWWRHMAHLFVGCLAMLAMLSFPYQRLAHRWIVRGLLWFTLGTLLFVLSMPEICNARRWIPMFFFNFQPSELAKLTTVVYVASVLSRSHERVNELWNVLLPMMVGIGSMALLIVVQPDLGSAVIPIVTATVMIFVAGLRWRYLTAVAGIGSIGFVCAVFLKAYRLPRITHFLDPWSDPLDKGYQLCQSLIAVGNGGLTGVGFGGGGQRGFLPAPHTDFIFSVVGEDFGLIGCSLLLAAFALLFWRGMRAAMNSQDRFGFYLALGITSMLVLQGLINMGVCLGMLPTKGLPLPFISYGGSSLLVSLTAMGLLLNVSLHSNAN